MIEIEAEKPDKPPGGGGQGGGSSADAQLRVTIRDIRAAGMCSSGARTWFNRFGLDWCKFVKCGLPATAILSTRDALGEVVVEKARKRGSMSAIQLPQLPAGEQ